jgi:hypothetical protein
MNHQVDEQNRKIMFRGKSLPQLNGLWSSMRG